MLLLEKGPVCQKMGSTESMRGDSPEAEEVAVRV
jgi:hypothetical protein